MIFPMIVFSYFYFYYFRLTIRRRCMFRTDALLFNEDCASRPGLTMCHKLQS